MGVPMSWWGREIASVRHKSKDVDIEAPLRSSSHACGRCVQCSMTRKVMASKVRVSRARGTICKCSGRPAAHFFECFFWRFRMSPLFGSGFFFGFGALGRAFFAGSFMLDSRAGGRYETGASE